ncbi:MAG: enoyl-CoA hydratase/isomerase family protein [Hyphomonadaceae bacterium]
MADLIISERLGGVYRLTLNRPDRHNAINDDMADAYEAALHEAVQDDGVRVILLCGAGRSFCSGRDVSVLGHRARDESDFNFVRRHQDGRLFVLDAPKPVVAALKGGVIGGGCEMALAADIRVASADLKMALPEIKYGLLPDTGGTQMLTALIGASRAKYMIMSGESIDARTALDWGAVDFVVAPEELDARALAIAQSLAEKPPIALAMAKQLVDQLDGPAIRDGMRQELLAQTALFKTEDYAEARAAHREKRAPRYKGK